MLGRFLGAAVRGTDHTHTGPSSLRIMGAEVRNGPHTEPSPLRLMGAEVRNRPHTHTHRAVTAKDHSP